MDVTERTIADRREDARHATTRVLAEASTLVEAVPQILQTICESLDWDMGALWSVDPQANVLRCVEVWHAPSVRLAEFEALTRQITVPPGIGLPGRVWAAGRPAWITDVTKDSNFPRAPIAAKEGVRGAFGFPITTGGEILGVIEFFTREARGPDADLLQMVVMIGSQIGQFIKHRWAEAEVRFQKALLESQSESTIDGILVVAPDGTMISFNQRFAEMWGIPEEVMATRSDAAALQSVLDKLFDPQEFLARVAYLYEHRDEESREQIALKDGRIFDRWSAPLTSTDGTYYGRAWYFRDISEQKRAERALEESKERFEFLARATTLLTASLDYSTVLERVAQLVVPTLADWCAVDVIEEDGSIHRLAVTHADPTQQEAARTLEHQAPDPNGTHPLLEVVQAGRARLFADVPDSVLVAAARDAEHLRIMRELGYQSAMIVPLIARGRTLGAISLVSTKPDRRYGPTDLALVEDLARRAALAVDNARLYGERTYVARTLQRSLLPPHLPDIPGLEVAAGFHAAGEGNEVGGDFYDLFRTGKDDWALVIGDVCGKGADAAAITALARYTLRGAAMQARKPSRVLAMLNEAMLNEAASRPHPDRWFCTVAYARVRPAREGVRLTIACGGHPLPLVLRGAGRVEKAGRPGTLLGMFPDPDLTDRVTHLAPGDAAVLYTDGVTEARAGNDVLGEDALRSLLESCGGLDAPAVAERVERAALDFQAGHPRDDIAVLVLRVPG